MSNLSKMGETVPLPTPLYMHLKIQFPTQPYSEKPSHEKSFITPYTSPKQLCLGTIYNVYTSVQVHTCENICA